jgi:protein transport protein SEC24
LDDIIATFSSTRITETILGPSISVGLKALSAANRNGKIFVFHTNLPTFEAPGRLKNREDRKLLGTDKEKTVLTEATDYYKKLGKECVTSGVSVDVFLFPNAHVDIASIAPVCQLSGGSIYKYQYFDVSVSFLLYLFIILGSKRRKAIFGRVATRH